MQSDALNRKLTAILYTDIAGYSRLTGADEEGTHRRVMALLDEVSESIKLAGGTVLRYAGDAILAEFPSIVTAMKTSIAIQSEIAGQNASIDKDRRIEVRIGVNIGDVIEDRGEVFGDGVNLAARLEAAAPVGGICISAAVHEQIIGKIDFIFDNGGIQTFKNINKPIHVFTLNREKLMGQQSSTFPSSKSASVNPSIAVLALTNLNHGPDLDFIGDGITEDVITALSKIRAFKVISRESTFSYKNKAIDIRQVAEELGVRYVLEGSVRKAGSRVRVTAQLIEAESGHHVWAERYDREMEDIFDLQDEMTQVIASALEPELNAAERERALLKSPDNLDAWEMYQRALWHMWRFEHDEISTARKLFKQAIQADPNFAPAYAYLSYSCYMTVIMGYVDDPDARLIEGLEYAETALKCDDKDAIPYFAIGRIQMMQGDHDASIASLRKSIQLNPCFAQSWHGLGFALSLAGELEESKLATAKAIDMSPRDPMLWAFTVVHALTCLLDNDNEEGLVWANRTMQIPSSTGYWAPAMVAAASANLGQKDEARKALAEAIKQKPDLSITFLKHNMPTRHENGLEPYLAGLRKAGLTEQ